MNESPLWSFDQDPPRDERLARLLRAADAAPRAGGNMDWDRLHAAIMGRATSAGPSASRGGARAWWDVLVQWRRVAAAASVAAMIAASALVWATDGGPMELSTTEDEPAESVALARVVAAYPDDAVFSSLVQTAHEDALTSWSAP
jgi:hypothetical protein